MHDPERQAQMHEARRKGGQNRGSAARLRGLVPPRLISVYDLLEKALEEVHRGDLDPRVAGAMAAIARAMVAVLTAGELEERLRALELQRAS
jgi:molybdenum-dependent DNA-binding transcriptional regulator ModE